MTVYGEVLFVENFIAGMLILYITGKVRGKKPGWMRIVVGSTACGTYAFVLFVKIHWGMALLSKLLFSGMVTGVVFRPKTLADAVKTTGAFYAVSFLAGGITIALMYVTKMPGMAANGSVYLKGITYFQIAAGLAATWIMGTLLADLLAEKIHRGTVLRKAEIHIGAMKWQVDALIDTGNSLREPLTGYPVAVLSKTRGMQISKDLGEMLAQKVCLIPYKGVGGKGMLYGFRPDVIYVGDKKITKVILGISEGDFDPWKGSETYEILLHQQLFEGEEKYD